MIENKKFKFGSLRFTMHVIKNEDKDKQEKYENYMQTSIDILNPVSNDEGQGFINDLEPGDYEIIIPLDNEHFVKKEHVDGEVIKNES